MIPAAENDVLFRHCTMVKRTEPRLWAEACWIDRIRGTSAKAKAERRVARKVRAFVAERDPANTDEEAKARDAVFEAFMRRADLPASSRA